MFNSSLMWFHGICWELPSGKRFSELWKDPPLFHGYPTMIYGHFPQLCKTTRGYGEVRWMGMDWCALPASSKVTMFKFRSSIRISTSFAIFLTTSLHLRINEIMTSHDWDILSDWDICVESLSVSKCDILSVYIYICWIALFICWLVSINRMLIHISGQNPSTIINYSQQPWIWPSIPETYHHKKQLCWSVEIGETERNQMGGSKIGELQSHTNKRVITNGIFLGKHGKTQWSGVAIF